MYKICLVLLMLIAIPAAAGTPMTPDSIQKQLLSRPWSVLDRETIKERDARSDLMARALYDAADEIKPRMSRKWLVGAAMSTWWYETRFSLEVHQGGLSRWGSDDGRAKCFGQLHERAVGIKPHDGEPLEDFRQRQHEKWKSLAGTDYESTKECALSTMRLLLVKLRNCGHLQDFDARWMGAFGDYGSGGDQCLPGPTSEKRLVLLKRIVPRL